VNDNRRRDLAMVGDLIDAVLGKVASVGVAPIVRLRQRWDDVAGEWAPKCQPTAIRDGVLTIEVASGMDASLIRYAIPQLLAAVTAELESTPAIDRITVRVRRS
jgi:predicted nucleic acid-binding Zn ribbon protein